ncbi:hypothetical protein GOP47_0006698 [Adiantum capillus-veneris]|uniref:Uncharacterized protein n=1 Tax=Adiantum capillus-veneris TaxID=13818 RepID=A0A9D4ZMA6_ADICA|nr:hypothetical protein GOP47_0006698 [Adiantum capillus-veneris]
MGFLLNLPITLRRWGSFYLWRQGYLSLQDNGGGGGGGGGGCAAQMVDRRHNYLWPPSVDDLISVDDYYDDKYVVSCNVHSNDSSMLTSFETNHDNSKEVYDINDGRSNYDVCKDSIEAADTLHKECSYDFCMDSTDSDNHYGGVEESDEDGDESGLLSGYYHPPHRKKRVVIVQKRARGLEGYWQRQAYLRSAYKFTRSKSMCDRAKVPVRKLRMTWRMIRGMYAKQARCMRGKLRSIADYARFHHTSFLLLSKHYLQYRQGAAGAKRFTCLVQQQY